MSTAFAILGAIICVGGISFVVAFAARFGWDTAGRHTLKAPQVTNTVVHIKGKEPQP